MAKLDPLHYRVNHVLIEGALKAFDLDRDVRFLEALSAQGYNYRIIEKTYPFPQYAAIIHAILERGLPGMDDKAAGRELGLRLYNAYAQTLIGRLVLIAANLAPIDRVIMLVMRAGAQNVSFGTRTTTALSPTHYRCNFDDDPAAQYPFIVESSAGLLATVCTKHGAPNARVKVILTGALSYYIDIEWRANS